MTHSRNLRENTLQSEVIAAKKFKGCMTFLYFNDFKYLIIRIYQPDFLVLWPGLEEISPKKKNSAFDECF